MIRKIHAFLFKKWGWKIVGEYPRHIKKIVLIVIPHTSAWDFPVGIFTRSHWQVDIKYVAKKSLFIPPLGWIMRAMGGVSVDRSKRNNFTDGVVEEFNKREEFAIVLSPEGTRGPVKKLKTGFWYIAKGANVPILMIRFNWEKKEVEIGPHFYPSDDIEADMKIVDDYFRGVPGYHRKGSYYPD